MTPEQRYDRIVEIFEVCDSLDWVLFAGDSEVIVDAPEGSFEEHAEFLHTIRVWKPDLLRVLQYINMVQEQAHA